MAAPQYRTKVKPKKIYVVRVEDVISQDPSAHWNEVAFETRIAAECHCKRARKDSELLFCIDEIVLRS